MNATEATPRSHTHPMSSSTQRTAAGSPLKLDVVIASLLLNGGILLALVTWITANRLDLLYWIGNEQLRAAASILAVGAPVAIAAAAAGRLSTRLPVDLGTGTLLALIAALSTVFTAAAVLRSVLPLDASFLVRLLQEAINAGTIFLMARIFARRARRLPDWISITGAIFAVGLLPLGLLSLAVETLSTWIGEPLSQEVNPLAVVSAAMYLAALLPALFFGRELLRAESPRFRPVERRFVEVFAAFGVGPLAAVFVPIATAHLYDTLQTCTIKPYACDRLPAEWVIIGLLTGFTAWRLIRGAERAKQSLLWIGALPPVLTTAIAINWYLPAWLGGLPIAGALISIGGLLLLRRATMATAPRPRRASKGR